MRRISRGLDTKYGISAKLPTISGGLVLAGGLIEPVARIAKGMAHTIIAGKFLLNGALGIVAKVAMHEPLLIDAAMAARIVPSLPRRVAPAATTMDFAAFAAEGFARTTKTAVVRMPILFPGRHGKPAPAAACSHAPARSLDPIEGFAAVAPIRIVFHCPCSETGNVRPVPYKASSLSILPTKYLSAIAWSISPSAKSLHSPQQVKHPSQHIDRCGPSIMTTQFPYSPQCRHRFLKSGADTLVRMCVHHTKPVVTYPFPSLAFPSSESL